MVSSPSCTPSAAGLFIDVCAGGDYPLVEEQTEIGRCKYFLHFEANLVSLVFFFFSG